MIVGAGVLTARVRKVGMAVGEGRAPALRDEAEDVHSWIFWMVESV